LNAELVFDPTAIPSRDYRIGEFILSWSTANGGSINIQHIARPSKSLWSTLPGVGFVAAARGREAVKESRGYFSIRDELKSVCDRQSIEGIVVDSGDLIVEGHVECADGDEQIGYTLVFSAFSSNQIRFSLSLSLSDFGNQHNRIYLTYASNANEHFFGFGEQLTHFDLKGKRVPVFVTEPGIGRGEQPTTFLLNLLGNAGGTWYTTSVSVPHYLTNEMRSVFLENYEYTIFDMRRDDRVQIKLFSDNMSGNILYGETPSQLIKEYTNSSGRMRSLPEWVHDGAVVGMQGGTERVRDIYEQLNQLKTPIAAFWLQDWVGQRSTLGGIGKQLWWNWELDDVLYFEWDDLRTNLGQDDIKLLVYVNPFLVDVSEKKYHDRNLFEEAKEKGYLVKDANNEPYLVKNTDFSAAMIDLTNPDAYDWMKGIIQEEIIDIGAYGWMADFGEALPYDARLYSGESAFAYHNQYPEDWARLNREAIEESGYGNEILFFTRSGYRNSPRYSTLFWLGDQLVSWDEHDGIKTAVTGLLSSGLSGFSFNHSDIGGYTTISTPVLTRRRSKELILRWMELNAFTSVYRTHEGFLPEANYQFYSDAETLEHFSKFAKVYKAWSFYRKQLASEAADTGLPVVRHPFVHYPTESIFYEMSYQQFMVGSEFMVVPVLDPGKDAVEAYLPPGHWVHLWSGELFGSLDQVTNVTVSAPLGEPGVFYKEKSDVATQFVTNLKRFGLLNE